MGSTVIKLSLLLAIGSTVIKLTLVIKSIGYILFLGN
uniref:Uncharacterized protein n=1 Tax=Zea mays TaxID=4577 RepID=C0PCG7_MAIZE|nr:unknown [Zea mays]